MLEKKNHKNFKQKKIILKKFPKVNKLYRKKRIIWGLSFWNIRLKEFFIICGVFLEKIILQSVRILDINLQLIIILQQTKDLKKNTLKCYKILNFNTFGKKNK